MSHSTATPALSLAARKRQLVRNELAEASVKVLASQGYEETTVEQIAAAVGMSRRAFFNYFSSKEDVVVHLLAGAGARLRDELRSRPAQEPMAVALRRAFTPFTRLETEDPDKTRRVAGLILHTPALQARFLERQAQWRADVAAVAVATFDTALQRWVDDDRNRSMAEIVDQAFAFVAPTLDLPAA